MTEQELKDKARGILDRLREIALQNNPCSYSFVTNANKYIDVLCELNQIDGYDIHLAHLGSMLNHEIASIEHADESTKTGKNKMVSDMRKAIKRFEEIQDEIL